jgi:hypothetical protein
MKCLLAGTMLSLLVLTGAAQAEITNGVNELGMSVLRIEKGTWKLEDYAKFKQACLVVLT